jgi:uncharacterized damage-inducible protein DinB
MPQEKPVLDTLYKGWTDHQALLLKALAPLTPEQLALKAASNLRSISDIARHIIAAETSWKALTEALERLTPTELDQDVRAQWGGQEHGFKRSWIIWHLIEHDLHHGGEISLTLGIHGLAAPDL